MSGIIDSSSGSLTGNNPGYIVTFHKFDDFGALVETPGFVLHSDAVEAEITVPVTGDLTPGAATVAFSGLSDADHQQIAGRTEGGANFRLPVARVHLFWRDTNHSVGGYLANLAGLGALTGNLTSLATSPAGTGVLDLTRVAELTVTAITRRRGERRYESVLSGTDRIAAASAARLWEPVSVTGLAAAARRLADVAGHLPVQVWPITPLDSEQQPDDIRFTARCGDRVRDALGQLATRIELVTGRTGRGMLLVREATLHVGTRPIPWGPDVKDLSWATGLLSVEAKTPIEVDGGAAGADGGTPARRDLWTVQLRGRSDLRPGDVVTFEPPPGEGSVQPDMTSALFGAFAAPLLGVVSGPRNRGYVSGVTHTVSRSAGFLTRLTLVGLTAGEDGWDRRPKPPGPAAVQGQAPPEHPDPFVALRTSLHSGMREHLSTLEIADVGEVRAHRPTAQGTAAAQRSVLWQGTTPSSDGGDGGAVRLPVAREVPLEKSGVPYATPFAWGRYGLVVPRYPGTRVVALHRHGRPEDPVDVGAVWPDDQGPTEAQAGDWWLSLPADVPPDQRTSLAADGDPAPHQGTATNDLVDADGRRVIEVGSLRVRVGKGGKGLPDVGARPKPAAEDVMLSIEHSDGTTLMTFSESGDVTIAAKGTLTLSGADVVIKASERDVAVQAANVSVKVDGTMEVK